VADEGRQNHLKKTTMNNMNISVFSEEIKTVKEEIGVLKRATCALQAALHFPTYK
jgi:hypothetical protein